MINGNTDMPLFKKNNITDTNVFSFFTDSMPLFQFVIFKVFSNSNCKSLIVSFFKTFESALISKWLVRVDPLVHECLLLDQVPRVLTCSLDPKQQDLVAPSLHHIGHKNFQGFP